MMLVMKSLRFVLFALVCTAGMGCKKEDDKAILPCLGNFKCEVDGNEWKPRSGGSCALINASYSYETGSFSLSTYDCRGVDNSVVSIVIWVDSLYSTGDATSNFRARSLKLINNSLVTYRLESGTINIDGFVAENYSKDYRGGFVSGRFDAVLKSDDGETIEITDATFCTRILN